MQSDTSSKQWTERAACGSIGLLLFCTAWARSGIYGPWHPLLWALFFFMLVACGICLIQADWAVRRRVLFDPLLPIGFSLFLLLFIQWRNAGGHPFLNLFTDQYRYMPPPIEGLPFSVEARLSREQLIWFTPVWIMLLAVRNLFTQTTVKWLFRVLVWNAAVLAVFGIVQYALGWTKLFGQIAIPWNPPLISTFEYSNHGGAFFYLFFAVAMGWLWDALEKRKAIKWIALFSLLSVLFAVTALCSLSRAAVLAVAALSLWTPAVCIWRWRHHLTASNWINSVLFVALFVVLLAGAILGIGHGAVLREFKGQFLDSEDIVNYHQLRGFQIPPALKMTRDHPWFGVGGWGYLCFARAYLPKDQWNKLTTARQNVHCDPIQFLAEHGVVGFGLMTSGLLAVLARWCHARSWPYHGLAIGIASGCGLVLMHSWIDLPFRCPTLLWHWLLLLAIVPQWISADAEKKQKVSGYAESAQACLCIP